MSGGNWLGGLRSGEVMSGDDGDNAPYIFIPVFIFILKRQVETLFFVIMADYNEKKTRSDFQ